MTVPKMDASCASRSTSPTAVSWKRPWPSSAKNWSAVPARSSRSSADATSACPGSGHGHGHVSAATEGAEFRDWTSPQRDWRRYTFSGTDGGGNLANGHPMVNVHAARDAERAELVGEHAPLIAARFAPNGARFAPNFTTSGTGASGRGVQCGQKCARGAGNTRETYAVAWPRMMACGGGGGAALPRSSPSTASFGADAAASFTSAAEDAPQPIGKGAEGNGKTMLRRFPRS